MGYASWHMCRGALHLTYFFAFAKDITHFAVQVLGLSKTKRSK